MRRLTDDYRITEENLRLRKTFIGFSAKDIAVLRGLGGWADRHADAIAREFYDHQFTFAPTRTFFERYAAEKGMAVSSLRPALERTQAGYFRQIFAEARREAPFGPEYFEKRLVVGRLHNVINLPLKWYVGSYPLYQDLVARHLRRSLPHRPLLRAKAERAISVVFNFDLQAVSDAFFYDYLTSIGLDLAAVTVDRPEEDLSEYYDEFKTAVRTTLEETARTSHRLFRVATSLHGAAEQTGLATTQIAGTIGQVAIGAQEQARAATETSDAVARLNRVIVDVRGSAEDTTTSSSAASLAVGSLTAAIREVSAASTEVGRVSGDAASAAKHGADAVRRTVVGMQRIQDTVAESSARVADLGQKSTQIGAIVETIDDIAAQTNLLALNAAIEAARAGEQGKGFAVVADEVRKLAERSSRATKEIAGLISEVQKVTDAAVAAMQAGFREVQAGSQLAEESGSALSEIATSVDATSVAVERIITAVGAMGSASSTVEHTMERIQSLATANSGGADSMAVQSRDVSRAVESIAAVTEQNSASSEEVSAAAEELSAQAVEIVDSAESLAQMASHLDELVARFTFEVDEDAVESIAPPAARPGLAPAARPGLAPAKAGAVRRDPRPARGVRAA